MKTNHHRLLAMAILLSTAFAALGVRLVFLQVVDHDKYRKLAGKNTQRVFLKEPRRGDILDARGNVLATSVPVKKICADPSLLGPYYPRVARELAPLLDYDETELASKLDPKIWRNDKGLLVTNRYVNLKRKVSVERWEEIGAALEKLTAGLERPGISRDERTFLTLLRRYGVYAVDDQQRVYLGKQLAAHVLGFVQEKEQEFNDTSVAEVFGVAGTEHWFNKQLAGVRGWRVTETDRNKREIVVYREQDVDPQPGLSVVLTIDSVVQNIVETELAEVMQKHEPVSASAMVVRPSTGEILAMACLPTFDPNDPGHSDVTDRRNRIISDIMEPGSTFKIVVVSAAFNDQVLNPNDLIYCEEGYFHFLGRTLRDHESYGMLTVENIIGKSSNIGAAKIGIQLGKRRLFDYIQAFGFGQRSGITLGAEENGLVHPVEKWDRLAISRIPMGQAIGVTHLQMMMAMCTVANGGHLMRPMLVNRLQEPSGQVFAQYQPQMIRTVLSERTCRQMVNALKGVVSREGTAPKAILEHYTVAGKTGTAQKAGNGHYLEGKYVASFIGFFPADEPEVCISVVLDEPRHGYYGGQTAAPVFKRIAEQVGQYLKIRPDREEKTSDALAGPLNRLSTAAIP